MREWAEFEKQFNFEQVVYDLVKKSIPLIARTFAEEMPFIAFAFNCFSAYGDLSLSVGSGPQCKAYDPPDWEHECIESEIPEMLAAWRGIYEPLRDRYCAESDRYCEEHGVDAWVAPWPNGFLHGLRRIIVRLEREGDLRALNPSGDIRTMVTEVDADTDEEARLLDAVRRSFV